jgi:hypothetical protein
MARCALNDEAPDANLPAPLRAMHSARAQSGDGSAAEGNATGMTTVRGAPRTERGGSVDPSPHRQRFYAARGSARSKCPERSDHWWHTAATLI